MPRLGRLTALHLPLTGCPPNAVPVPVAPLPARLYAAVRKAPPAAAVKPILGLPLLRHLVPPLGGGAVENELRDLAPLHPSAVGGLRGAVEHEGHARQIYLRKTLLAKIGQLCTI